MLCGYTNMCKFNSYKVKSKYISHMSWTETFDKHIQVLGILVQA